MPAKTPNFSKRANERETSMEINRMTPEELKSARIAAGLSPMQAASLVHVDKRTWQRYEADTIPIPGAIVELFAIKTGMDLGRMRGPRTEVGQ